LLQNATPDLGYANLARRPKGDSDQKRVLRESGIRFFGGVALVNYYVNIVLANINPLGSD